MILARNSITLHHLRDITTVVWYYKLQASTASPPAKPTTSTPSGWTTTEPSYTEGSTNSLYVCQKTTFSDGSFEYSDVSLSTSYEAAKAAYNKSVQAKDAADAAQESVDNLEIGGRNYLRAEPKSHSASAYGAYDLYVTEPPEAGQTYTIQLWNVDVSHSGKTAAQLGVNVYYCGGSVNWGGWIGTNYFTDGHADHLTLTFTPTEAQISHSNVTKTAKKFIRLYNSVPSATGTMSMTVGGWKLEKGNRATDWTPAPEDLQADIDTLQPELIVGTHGTTATATWTGTSTVLTEIKAGTRIQYKLSSAGASNVTLNLTLKGGTTTGAKPVYFLNTTRLGTQYGVNAIVDLIYDGSAWRVLNPYTNSNTVGTYGGAVKAGANGVKNYSLVMRDTETTWVSLTTTAGTGTSKSRYTGKLYPDKVMYMGSNSAYASGATTGTCYEALGVNLQYSTNCGSTLTSGRAVYLVGTLDSDGLFTLDATWWTQTIPTTADGKTYIYLGLAYSTTSIYLVPENTLYQYYEGAFRTLREIEEMKAAKVADNYLSSDNTGIMVADMTDGNTYTPSTVPSGVKNTFIDNDSFQVRDGTDVIARFGEESQIGKDDENHQVIDSSGIEGINAEGVKIFDIAMDGATKKALLQKVEFTDATFTCEYGQIKNTRGPAQYVGKDLPQGNVVFTYTLEESYSDGTKVTTEDSFEFGEVPIGGESEYLSAGSVRAKYYNENSRGWHVETRISLMYITPPEEPYITSISITYKAKHVYRTVKVPAFTFGTRITESGAFSSAMGEGLSAEGANAIAIGKYNVDSPDYAFMVGNGSIEDGESNAFAVTWDGNHLMALDQDAATGTDAELYAAITAHGWESEVIV